MSPRLAIQRQSKIVGVLRDVGYAGSPGLMSGLFVFRATHGLPRCPALPKHELTAVVFPIPDGPSITTPRPGERNATSKLVVFDRRNEGVGRDPRELEHLLEHWLGHPVECRPVQSAVVPERRSTGYATNRIAPALESQLWRGVGRRPASDPARTT